MLLGGLAGAASLVAGCDLPRGAPMRREILRGATSPEADFAVYPVTREFLPVVAEWPDVNPLPSDGWIGYQRGSPARMIAPGDLVSVAVWDAEDNSLLTTPGQRVVELEGIRVAPSGTVFLPYVGDVRVAGLSEQRARETIEASMTEIIPSAQVQLALEEGRANSAEVVSGVARPGRYPLEGGDRTVLSLIAEAGGVPERYANPLVRLHRDGRIYLTSIERLFEDPRLDTTLRGGDRIVVVEDPRTFLALGASGVETVISFTEDRLSALDAVALVGGIQDTRADPEGVLVLREYPPEALAPGVRGPRQQQVVFVLDLTSAEGIFSARRFQIAPADAVLVTESPVTTTEAVFGVINSTVNTARRAAFR